MAADEKTNPVDPHNFIEYCAQKGYLDDPAFTYNAEIKTAPIRHILKRTPVVGAAKPDDGTRVAVINVYGPKDAHCGKVIVKIKSLAAVKAGTVVPNPPGATIDF